VRLVRNSKQKDYGIEERRTKWLGEKGVFNNGAHQPRRTQNSYLLFRDRLLYVFLSDKPIDLFLSLLLPVGMELFSGGNEWDCSFLDLVFLNSQTVSCQSCLKVFIQDYSWVRRWCRDQRSLFLDLSNPAVVQPDSGGGGKDVGRNRVAVHTFGLNIS